MDNYLLEKEDIDELLVGLDLSPREKYYYSEIYLCDEYIKEFGGLLSFDAYESLFNRKEFLESALERWNPNIKKEYFALREILKFPLGRFRTLNEEKIYKKCKLKKEQREKELESYLIITSRSSDIEGWKKDISERLEINKKPISEIFAKTKKH